MLIDVDWATLKTYITNKAKLRYIDRETFYLISYKDDDSTFQCSILIEDPANADQDDFETNYKEDANKPILKEVRTQFERDDLILKLACAQGVVDENQECILTLIVPGTPGVNSGRYVAGGYGFSDIYTFGDKFAKVEIVDIDDLLGYGPNTVLASYHDDDLPEANQGWLLWCEDGNQGGVDIDPIGYYGNIPSGLYLRITYKGVETTLATKVAVNIWWGESE